MKQKWKEIRINKRIAISSVLVVGFMVGAFFFFMNSPDSTPDQAMQQYLEHWEEGDYQAMYELLSAEAKKRISQKEFMKQHESIAKKMKQKQIKLDMKTAQEKDRNTIPFSAKIVSSLVGNLSFQNKAELVEEDNGWRVNWTPSVIFPEMKEGDQIRTLRIPPGQRGEITARNGEPLAVNKKRTAVGMVPNEVTDLKKTSKKLAKALDLEPKDVYKKVKSGAKKNPDRFVEIKTWKGDGKKQIKPLKKIDDISIRDRSLRVYPRKDLTAHVTGYIRPITEKQLKKRKKEGYQKGDWIGQRGLEQTMEEHLRGAPGWKVVIANKNGKQKKVLGTKPPTDGKDLQVTIDLETQAQLYQGMKKDKGGGVAIDPRTGEVLAMVSAPSYDPNQFIQGMSQSEWKRISGPTQPLANRAKLTYAPGSTMKAITAAIGLDTKKITPKTTYNTDSGKWQKNSSWGGYYVTRVDNPGGGVDLGKALAWSDNIYFARVGLKIGAPTMIKYYKKFGFDETIDLPLQVTPSQYANSNNKTLKNEILLADTAYGQGQLLVSPLHLATMYTTFANQGDMIKPKILMDSDKKVKREIWKEKVISPQTANKVKELLQGVVERPKGSARDLKVKGVELGAKTGTAELKQSKEDENGRELGWLAWMAGKEGEKPDIVVATMVDEVQDRGGSHYIFPTIKKMLKQRYH
ncbi:penicillin-binding transpeptidase domain-containing protein [Melghirimyces algeriensis]|nr:penicillin-binding transpeptidase domain-containing protein [Melghirimyces algeriensis]